MTHDPDVLYAGGTTIQRSDDGGASFTANSYAAQTHADIQQIGVPPFDGTNAGVVFACTDGGLWKSTNYGATYAPLNNDLMVTQFFCVGASQRDNTVMGGTMDNHNFRRSNTGSWSAIGIGDGGLSTPINPNDPELYAYSDIYNRVSSVDYLKRNSSGTVVTQTLNTPAHAAKPFLYQHDEPNTLLCAVDKMYRVTDGTLTTGSTFKSALSSTDQPKFSNGNVALAFQYCYTQSNVIYLATSGQWRDGDGDIDGYGPGSIQYDQYGYSTFNFFKSTDGGSTWQSIPTNLTGLQGRISSVAVHPTNPNKICKI